MGDSGTFHMPGSSAPVFETPQGGFATYAHGTTWNSGNGYDWAPQVASGGGNMSYHWEQGGGFTSSSGSVAYGDHGMHLNHSEIAVQQSGHFLTATDGAGHVYQSNDNGVTWRAPDGTSGGGMDYRWEPGVGFTHNAVVSGDQGMFLRNSETPILRSEQGGFTAHTETGVYNSFDGRTWHLQEGSGGTGSGTNISSGDRPVYSWDQSHHVMVNEALTQQGGQDLHLRTPAGDMPVTVQSDNSGHTILAGQYGGHTIYSDDGGSTWYGQYAGEHYAVRHGELTAINNAGEAIPYGSVANGSSTVVNYDQDGHALSKFVPDAYQAAPPTNVNDTTVYGGAPLPSGAPVSETTLYSGAPLPSGAQATVSYDSTGNPVAGIGPSVVPPAADASPYSGVSTGYDRPLVTPSADASSVVSTPNTAFGNYYVGSESSTTHCVIPGTNLTASFDAPSNSWLVDGSSGQVTFNKDGDGGMTVTGSNISANYSPSDEGRSGTFYSYAADNPDPIVLRGPNWEMQTAFGEIPTHVSQGNWVPDQAGIIAPTAQYVEPNVTDWQTPAQPDPYALTGTQLTDTSWNPAMTQEHPTVAFETDHSGDVQPVGGFFVGDSARRNEPPADSPFQPAAAPIVPVPYTPSTLGSGPFSGRLRSLVAGTQPGAAKPATPPSEIVRSSDQHSEDLHTQMSRADRRRARLAMTPSQYRQWLIDQGYNVDDEGNIIT